MIRAAIVGLGRWGQNLVASVQGKSDAIRFVAGATRTPEKAQAFADAHGFPLHESYEKLLADPAIDAVVLATPHTLHAGQIIAAAKARKHVFAEKPFALALRDAEAAVRACAENKVTESSRCTRRAPAPSWISASTTRPRCCSASKAARPAISEP